MFKRLRSQYKPCTVVYLIAITTLCYCFSKIFRRSATDFSTIDRLFQEANLDPSAFPIVVDGDLLDCILYKNCNLTGKPFFRFALLPQDFDFEINKSSAARDRRSLLYKVGEQFLVLSRIESKGDYWLIPKVDFLEIDEIAFLKPILSPILLGNTTVYVDSNLELYYNQLKRAKHIRCRSEMARNLKEQHPEMFDDARRNIPKNIVERMAALRNLFYSQGIFPFFEGGTLLGWYRECGILSHTTDIDLLFHATELSPNTIDFVNSLKPPPCKVVKIFGFLHDSLQIQLSCMEVRFDVSAIYSDENCYWIKQKCEWLGGTAQGVQKYRFSYPFGSHDQICTADLYGFLFFVPCQVEKILSTAYGAKWAEIHHSQNYSWNRSPRNIYRIEDWENSF